MNLSHLSKILLASGITISLIASTTYSAQAQWRNFPYDPWVNPRDLTAGADDKPLCDLTPQEVYQPQFQNCHQVIHEPIRALEGQDYDRYNRPRYCERNHRCNDND